MTTIKTTKAEWLYIVPQGVFMCGTHRFKTKKAALAFGVQHSLVNKCAQFGVRRDPPNR